MSTTRKHGTARSPQPVCRQTGPPYAQCDSCRVHCPVACPVRPRSMSAEKGLREELGRIRSVSDMLCTGHAGLRDHYKRMALALDLSILALSTWLAALAFVAPNINLSLTPFGLDSQLWVGFLSVAVLFL